MSIVANPRLWFAPNCNKYSSYYFSAAVTEAHPNRTDAPRLFKSRDYLRAPAVPLARSNKSSRIFDSGCSLYQRAPRLGIGAKG
jgi:hypothetical protein